jgi:hypothetical protein
LANFVGGIRVAPEQLWKVGFLAVWPYSCIDSRVVSDTKETLETSELTFANIKKICGRVTMDELLPGLIAVALYAFFSYTLMVIGEKLNVPNAWLAWIPIANIWVMCRAAGKPGWWVLLFFIPLVNLIFGIWVIFAIPPRLNKSRWLGLLVFLPVLGALLYSGILAFT